MNDTNAQIVRDQFLKHHGIRGMKWGVRKRSVSASKPKSKSKNGLPSIIGQNRNSRRMTNKELNARVKRIKLEQEYLKLTEVPKPKTVSKVEKLVKAAGTIAALSGSASTIYKNLNDLGVINSNAKKGS